MRTNAWPLLLAAQQWLFMLEGVPSVLLGVVVFFLLPDHPRHARWLSAQEKALLADDVRAAPAAGCMLMGPTALLVLLRGCGQTSEHAP